MSLGHGASTVRSGLLLYLDAANKKSYSGTGTVWNDLSGNSKTSTLQNGPTYNSAGYITCDGLDDHITVGNSTTLAWTPNGAVGTSEITIDMWVRSSDTVGKFYTKPWNGSGQYNIHIGADAFTLQAGISGTTVNSIAYGRNISNGTWTNIVCWANSNYMGYYLNYDQFYNSKLHSLTGDIPTVGNSNVTTGLMTYYPYGSGWAGNTSFSILGDLASCRVYNRVLLAAEIAQNFNALRGRYGI